MVLGSVSSLLGSLHSCHITDGQVEGIKGISEC